MHVMKQHFKFSIFYIFSLFCFDFDLPLFNHKTLLSREAVMVKGQTKITKSKMKYEMTSFSPPAFSVSMVLKSRKENTNVN